jgi:hypothetical protein
MNVSNAAINGSIGSMEWMDRSQKDVPSVRS